MLELMKTKLWEEHLLYMYRVFFVVARVDIYIYIYNMYE